MEHHRNLLRHSSIELVNPNSKAYMIITTTNTTSVNNNFKVGSNVMILTEVSNINVFCINKFLIIIFLI